MNSFWGKLHLPLDTTLTSTITIFCFTCDGDASLVRPHTRWTLHSPAHCHHRPRHDGHEAHCPVQHLLPMEPPEPLDDQRCPLPHHLHYSPLLPQGVGTLRSGLDCLAISSLDDESGLVIGSD